MKLSLMTSGKAEAGLPTPATLFDNVGNTGGSQWLTLKVR